MASSLAWIEVSRALRGRLDRHRDDAVNHAIEDALSGIAERPIGADVVSLARRIEPNLLHSLDAIHLASAILLDADLLLTYHSRLAEAAHHPASRSAHPADRPAWLGPVRERGRPPRGVRHCRTDQAR